MTSGERLAVVLMVALWSSLASASEVVVFDRGGGAQRTAVTRQAAASAGDTVLTAAESDELDRAYAGGCVDADCYSRAGAAGSVSTVILVEATAITSIDVATVTARTRPAPTEAVAQVLARLRDPAHFGTLDVSAVPSTYTVVVEGVRYAGGDVPAGPLSVVLRGPDGERTVVVDVLAGTATPVVVPAPSVNAGTVLVVSGAAVAVAGTVVGLLGELWAQAALTSLQQRQPADLGQAEAVQLAGFIGAGVGVVGAGVGVVLLTNSAGAVDDTTPQAAPSSAR